MIKVIKHGTAPVFTEICPNCGCEFEFTVEDIKVKYESIFPTEFLSSIKGICCPDCGEQVIRNED